MDQFGSTEKSLHPKYFSWELFMYLCHIIGSEKVVRTRRLFFKILDDVYSQHSFKTFISSGSKAEGLDMIGSDLDIMVVFRLLPVFHDRSEINSTVGYLTDTDNTAPGFVLLKGISGHYDATFNTYTEYGPVLSNEKFKTFYKTRFQRPDEDAMKIHGPCLTPCNELLDIALCFKSQTWPLVARKWLHRPRYSGWPSSSVISTISQVGLLYVPIGSKFGSTENNHYEWRISFSVPEKLLIHSFNHTQLLCYALLKIVLKEIIETKTCISKLLCSYFMKTVVFWISEESDPFSWTPENLFSCFQSCLRRLIYWVRLGYCPNYFIPQNNMFEGKIYGKSQRELLDFLTQLNGDGMKFIDRSVTLRRLLDKNDRVHLPCNEDIDKAIYPLLNIYVRFQSIGIARHRYIPLFLKLIRDAKHLNNCKLAKALYLLHLVQFCMQMIIETPYDFSSSNKRLYPQYKMCRFYCLIGTNFDVVSGWVWLAAFFYHHKEYQKALFVTDYALHECTPDKIFIDDYTPLVYKRNPNNSVNTTFLQRHKISCIYYLWRVPFFNSLFFNTELGLCDIEQGILAPPVVFIHYLRFMCYHRLNDSVNRGKCLKDIRLTIEEDFFISCPELRTMAYLYLIKALETAKRFAEIPEVEDKLYSEFLRYLPKYADLRFTSFFKFS